MTFPRKRLDMCSTTSTTSSAPLTSHVTTTPRAPVHHPPMSTRSPRLMPAAPISRPSPPAPPKSQTVRSRPRRSRQRLSSPLPPLRLPSVHLDEPIVDAKDGGGVATHSKKRTRSTRDEILRELAADAIREMRGQGLAPPPMQRDDDKEPSRRRVRARVSFGFGKENRVSPPQSPKSFYRKIGLEVDAPSRTRAPRVPLAPLDDCVTPDRAVRKMVDPEASGSITPARVQAAKCLLSLMQ